MVKSKSTTETGTNTK